MAIAKCPRCGERIRVDAPGKISCPVCAAAFSIKTTPLLPERPAAQAKVPSAPPPDELALTAERPPIEFAPPPARAGGGLSKQLPWIAAGGIGFLLFAVGIVAAIMLAASDQPTANTIEPKRKDIEPTKVGTQEPSVQPSAPAPPAAKQVNSAVAASTEVPKKELSPFQKGAKSFCRAGLVYLNLLATNPPLIDVELHLRKLRTMYANLPFADGEKGEKQRDVMTLPYKLLEGIGRSYANYRDAKAIAAAAGNDERIAKSLEKLRSLHVDGTKRARAALESIISAIDGKANKTPDLK